MRAMAWMCGLAMVATTAWLAPRTAAAQAVDYHRAQQAGKVWERKQLDIDSGQAEDAPNSQGIAYDAPLTPEDLQITRRNNPGAYEELERSVGKKNADRWLDMKARIERAKR
jgi:hypothetical protein